jgi:hypothetical protein
MQVSRAPNRLRQTLGKMGAWTKAQFTEVRAQFTLFNRRLRKSIRLYGKATLVVAPILANVALVLFDAGVCWRFGIPFYLISITPDQVITVSVTAASSLLVLILLTQIGWLLYFTLILMFRALVTPIRRFVIVNVLHRQAEPPMSILEPLRIFVEQATSITHWFGLALVCCAAAFYWWYSTNFPAWEVFKHSSCVMLLRMGDEFVAADYTSDKKTKFVFTVYHADNLPQFVYFNLGLLKKMNTIRQARGVLSVKCYLLVTRKSR